MSLSNFITDMEISALRAAYRDHKLVPFIGAGFSKNIRNKKNMLPDWPALVNGILEDMNKENRDTSEIDLLVEYEDYISALTLIKRHHVVQLNRTVEEIINLKTKKIRQDEFDIFMAFWGSDWRAVVTTNFDKILEITALNGKSISHQNSELIDEFRKTVSSTLKSHVVFHLHGMVDGGNSCNLLLTWSDYFRAYNIDSSNVEQIKKVIIRNLDKNLVGKQDNLEVYKKILFDILDSEAEIGMHDVKILPNFLEYLLKNCNLLFIGFSFTDTFWQFMQWITAINTGFYINSRHFIISDETDYSNYLKKTRLYPGKFTILNIKSYNNLGDFLYCLGNDLSSISIEKRNIEMASRASRYRQLYYDYGDFSTKSSNFAKPKWLYERNGKIIPVIELWCNKDNISWEDAIKYNIPNKKRYNLPKNLKNAADKYWQFREELQNLNEESEPLINEMKVRINEYKIEGSTLHLEVEPTEYKEYLITNHFVANMNEVEQVNQIIARSDESLANLLKEAFKIDGIYNPRKYLCDQERIILSPNCLCSNHLGISTLLIGKYDYPATSESDFVLLCVPSRGQISSPNEIVPTASGSADWPLLMDAESCKDIVPLESIGNPSSIKLEMQIWRELLEECFSKFDPKTGTTMGIRHRELMDHSYDRIKPHINKCILINFCQNIERGGNPELFYLMTLKVSINKFLKFFYPNWEINPSRYCPETRRSLMQSRSPSIGLIHFMPSPLDDNLTPSRIHREAIDYLTGIIETEEYNTILKAHLVSIIHYCKRVYPEEFADVWED